VATAVRLTGTGLVAAATMLVAAACGGVDSASAASITHDDLVSELVAQLAGVSTLSYTATYQLAGGDEAQITQAQKPARVAYAFPGGRLIRTSTGTIRCKGQDSALICTETTPAQADASAAGALTTPDAGAAGPLTTPDTVLAMLNMAAADTGVVAKQHDTTIAGNHATCLDLTGVAGTATPDFSVCVTAEGALGSFTATIKGKQADLALTAYSDKPDLSAFDLPPTAKLTDQRN
jgi:outer membrane lipoprotein-sorting protein